MVMNHVMNFQKAKAITTISLFLLLLLASFNLVHGNEEVPFSKIMDEINKYNVESLLLKDTFSGVSSIEAALKDGRVLYSEPEVQIPISNLYSLIKDYGLDCIWEESEQYIKQSCDKMDNIIQIYDSVIPFPLIIFSSFLASVLFCWVIALILVKALIRKYNNKYGILAITGFGMTTYGVVIAGPLTTLISGGGFSYDLMSYAGFFGWVFAISAIVMAGVGLSKGRYRRLNITTVVIAILLLALFIFTMANFA